MSRLVVWLRARTLRLLRHGRARAGHRGSGRRAERISRGRRRRRLRRGFLIGRPYPLFRIMFRSAAEQHNVLYGAAAFALQSVGNIVVMAVQIGRASCRERV